MPDLRFYYTTNGETREEWRYQASWPRIGERVTIESWGGDLFPLRVESVTHVYPKDKHLGVYRVEIRLH